MKVILKKYNSIGNEEAKAAQKVMQSGNLSEFVAGNSKSFFGGKHVLKFEKYLRKFYKVKHAITLNSWTSGLIAIVGSLDIEPGDEIIVTPWSMCATSTAILHWNCIPVFADIDPKTFNIDPSDVKKKITNKTKAIMAADIFGYPCDVDALKKIVKGTKIKVITDSAQSPYSKYKGKITGTISDIGGYSLNYHKIIHTGEGGIVVTNNTRLANRVKLLRNHGEVKINSSKKKELSNILGHNFRMGELEAAIGIEQYKKLKNILKTRFKRVKKLIKNLQILRYISLPDIKNYYSHNFYILPIVLDKKISHKRKLIVNLLKKNGIEGIGEGYANLHRLSMFKHKIAYGTKNFPWSLNKKKYFYGKGLCSIAEDLHDNRFISFEICLYDLNDKSINDISRLFKYVWKKLKI
jgi:perosamine synthetase